MAEKYHSTTAAEMAKAFFAQLVVNSVVIVIANKLFPNNVVLGTANFSFGWSVFHSMLALSVIGTLCVPIFEWRQKMLNRSLSMNEWMLGYLFINFVGLWVITRFSEQFGLGISAWWITLIIAAVLDIAQGMSMALVYKDAK